MEILSAVAACIKCFTGDGGSSSNDEPCESEFAIVSLYSRSEGFF